jgi:hypothetical protein
MARASLHGSPLKRRSAMYGETLGNITKMTAISLFSREFYARRIRGSIYLKGVRNKLFSFGNPPVEVILGL